MQLQRPFAGSLVNLGPRKLVHTRRIKPRASPNEASSLIPQSLDELDSDTELQELLTRIQNEGQATLTKEEERLRQRSLARLGLPSFSKACSDAGVTPLTRAPTSIFQLNIGLYCNQACSHCHVEASPRRTEVMSHEVASRCIELLDNSTGISTFDITGGAPELCPEFQYLVKGASARGVEVLDRCNLTVLMEPGQEYVPEFLAEHKCRVVASLPCYTADNVDSQRGKGVFERSIAGLRKLNAVGYGMPGTGLYLDLVYNPGGVFLAPPQAKLEEAYRQELRENFGIEFSTLFCLNNMPIKRWVDHLQRQGKVEEYMELLVNAFNPSAAEGVMCRNTVSVRWDGRIYDCDFNQQLDIGLDNSTSMSVFDINSLDELIGKKIAVASHCYGCTAGAGSSCQGATT